MKNESGQALVLVLLSLAIVLTLVLFVLSRSVTDISVSSNQEQSVRAFSAAEAGVERALVIGSGVGLTTIGDASYSSNVTSFSQGSTDFNYPILLSSGDSMTNWFVAHDANSNLVCDGSHPCFTGNTIKVCWGKPGTSSSSSTTPAVELTVFYESAPGDLATIKVARAAFDPYTSRQSANAFSSADSGSCTISGVSYAFQKTVQFSNLGIASSAYNVAGGLQFARIRMLYNTDSSQPVGATVNGFAGDSTLPSQGQDIVSTGVAGQSNRRIEVFQSWPEIPSIFEYPVYSSGGLTK